MNRRWLFVGGFVVAMAGLWLALSPRVAPTPSAPEAAPAAEPEPAPTPAAPAQPENTATPSEPASPTPPAAAPAPGPEEQKPRPRSGMPVPTRMGPIDELKRAFETEPRESASHAVETQIETAFHDPRVSPALFKSVVCRRSVCRITLEWSQERAAGYMAVFIGLMMGKNRRLAIEPASELDAEQRMAVNAYITRDATNPTPPPPAQPVPATPH